MDKSSTSESILVNSSYKRRLDKSFENVFVMPIKKSKHEENKIYSEIDLIERQFDETDERPILLTKTNESSDYNQIKRINDIDKNVTQVIPLKIDDELQPHDSNVIIHSLEGNNEAIEVITQLIINLNVQPCFC